MVRPPKVSFTPRNGGTVHVGGTLGYTVILNWTKGKTALECLLSGEFAPFTARAAEQFNPHLAVQIIGRHDVSVFNYDIQAKGFVQAQASETTLAFQIIIVPRKRFRFTRPEPFPDNFPTHFGPPNR